MSDIQTLMRSANPVHDVTTEFGQDDLDALLLLTRTRSTEMDLREVTRPVKKGPRRGRSGLLAAAAAFGAVVVLIGSLVVLNRRTDPEIPPATVTTTTVPSTTAPATTTITEPSTTSTAPAPEVDAAAVAYIEALVADLNAGDVDAMTQRILEAKQVGFGDGAGGTEQPIRAVTYWIGIEVQAEILGCRMSDVGITKCDVDMYSDYFPFAPLPMTGQWQVRLDGTEVAFQTWYAFAMDPWFQIDLDFQAWVVENYPEYQAVILVPTDPVRAAELTKQIVAEYREQAGLSG